MSIESRLAELGVTLPTPWSPVANYVPARLSGDHLYLSGHVARRDGSVLVGRFGADLSSDDGYAAARSVALDLLASAQAALGSLDRVRMVLKLTGFVNSTPEFTDQPAVMNGASDLLVAVFGEERGKHARSAVGVTQLPLGAALEVEAILAIV